MKPKTWAQSGATKKRSITPRRGIYKGIEFRSQLEISWAEFFDFCGIKWVYEDTSAYDFQIGKCAPLNACTLYVEVKPLCEGLIAPAIRKLVCLDCVPLSFWHCPVLIAGHPTGHRYGQAPLVVVFRAFRIGIENPTRAHSNWCQYRNRDNDRCFLVELYTSFGKNMRQIDSASWVWSLSQWKHPKRLLEAESWILNEAFHGRSGNGG